MSTKITIGFRLEDEHGGRYTQNSTFEVFTELGETNLEAIGRQLNCFLKQCGYVRENDLIFMEDITEDEYNELLDCLCDIRENQEEYEGDDE